MYHRRRRLLAVVVMVDVERGSTQGGRRRSSSFFFENVVDVGLDLLEDRERQHQLRQHDHQLDREKGRRVAG